MGRMGSPAMHTHGPVPPPAVNRTAFPNTKYGSKSNDWYWANTQCTGSNYGWAINYDDGFTGCNSGASGAWNYFTAAYVKCVR